ncbi:hypothetical protein [uncultured Pontibacter sp.]|uniref:hypothetical protein n=1 Tax=uncultured Pontibacter sp. TaxID=453356 RepID=UPI00262D5AAE|nr:hypothetical protein [uncultured Pontibacter sp.]
MKVELIIDDQVREFTLEPGEAFELPEETLQEIEKELLLQEARAIKKQLVLDEPKSQEDN